MPSKFTKRLGRRATLTAKRGNVNYYKGRGGRSEGVHTSKGKFVVLAERTMRIVAPNLEGCKLRPYVFARAPARGQRVPAWDAAPAPAAAELR